MNVSWSIMIIVLILGALTVLASLLCKKFCHCPPLNKKTTRKTDNAKAKKRNAKRSIKAARPNQHQNPTYREAYDHFLTVKRLLWEIDWRNKSYTPKKTYAEKQIRRKIKRGLLRSIPLVLSLQYITSISNIYTYTLSAITFKLIMYNEVKNIYVTRLTIFGTPIFV